MEGENKNNSKFISDCMKGIIDDLDTRKGLFNLIKFYGATVVQVVGELLEVYRSNLTYILCTLHGGNNCFSDIGSMDFAKNLMRVSRKFHHCYAFFQKTVC